MVWVLLLCAVAGCAGQMVYVLGATVLSSLIFLLRRQWAAVPLCVTSAAWCLLCVHSLEADRAAFTSQNPVHLSGMVCGFPSAGRYGSTFPFETRVAGRVVRVRVRANRYDIDHGQRLELSGTRRRLRHPIAGMAGEFRAVSVRRIDGNAGRPVTRCLWTVHARSRMILSRRLGAHSALPLALTLGERGFVSPRQRGAFRRLGISHLFALSGMHLGILGAALVLVLPGRSGRALCAPALVLVAFVMVVGDVDSLERALAMTLLALLARALARPVRPRHLWACAACLLLWRDPGSFASPGLQFSLLATLGVIVTFERLRGPTALMWRGSWARRALAGMAGTLAAGIGATLAVLPLQLHYFEGVSPAGPLATVVFAPVVAALLVASLALLALAGLPGAGPIEVLVLALSRALGAMLEAGGSLPIPFLRPDPPRLVVYCAGLLLVGAPTGRWGTLVGFLMLAVSFVW